MGEMQPTIQAGVSDRVVSNLASFFRMPLTREACCGTVRLQCCRFTGWLDEPPPLRPCRLDWTILGHVQCFIWRHGVILVKAALLDSRHWMTVSPSISTPCVLQGTGKQSMY